VVDGSLNQTPVPHHPLAASELFSDDAGNIGVIGEIFAAIITLLDTLRPAIRDWFMLFKFNCYFT